MKKLNKLFLGLASVGAVAAPIAAVVSCGSTNSGITEALGEKLNVSSNAKVWMVSDGGTVQDKTFNEGALNGVAKYGNTTKTTYNFVQSVDGQLPAAYSKAAAGGAEILVGAGFKHDDGQSAKGTATTWAAANPSKFFLGIDTAFGQKGDLANVGSITYKTEKAGYLAGAYAYDYIAKHKDQFVASPNNGHYQAATFGGGKFLAVTSWMDGFKQALAEASSANGATIQVDMVYANGTVPTASDFTTDGFASPSSQAQELVKKYLANGADVIFPVAGAQIKDALSVVRGQRVKVLGVDGDQNAVYNTDQIIGSALKDISGEVIKALTSFYADAAHTAFKAEYNAKLHDGATGFVYYNNGVKKDYTAQEALAITHATAVADGFPTIATSGSGTFGGQ